MRVIAAIVILIASLSALLGWRVAGPTVWLHNASAYALLFSFIALVSGWLIGIVRAWQGNPKLAYWCALFLMILSAASLLRLQFFPASGFGAMLSGVLEVGIGALGLTTLILTLVISKLGEVIRKSRKTI